MARKSAHGREYNSRRSTSDALPELSLESILEEYRLLTPEETGNEADDTLLGEIFREAELAAEEIPEEREETVSPARQSEAPEHSRKSRSGGETRKPERSRERSRRREDPGEVILLPDEAEPWPDVEFTEEEDLLPEEEPLPEDPYSVEGDLLPEDDLTEEEPLTEDPYSVEGDLLSEDDFSEEEPEPEEPDLPDEDLFAEDGLLDEDFLPEEELPEESPREERPAEEEVPAAEKEPPVYEQADFYEDHPDYEGAEIVEEGYEEDGDFYAGAVSTEETEDAGDEEVEEGEANEETEPGEKTLSRRGKRKAAAGEEGLWGRLTAWLDAGDEKRREREAEDLPEPEDKEREMDPRRAVKYYAAQMPALKKRSLGAVFVSLLLLWITLSCGFGWPLPGHLETDTRLSAIVCMVGELTVMLLGLDIVTTGVMSLLRGRPGAESMIVLALLASLAEGIFTAAVTTDYGLPFAVLPSMALTCALIGGWFTCRSYKNSFLALYHAKMPYVLSSEDLGNKKERILIKYPRPSAGFIRRSEEPDVSEMTAEAAFLPMAAVSAALALAIALGSRQIGSFFHLFAALTGVCVSLGWLLAFPMMFDRASEHLMLNGSALAGWNGAREIGRSRRLVLTDTDIFPEGTVEITGVRLLDKNRADEIIASTGSLLSAAGTGTASVFMELMRRNGTALRKVENFSVGDGGVKASVEERNVHCGTLGYMHLSGVKVPDKMKYETAVYTAIDGELMGVFLFRYHPVGSVQRALMQLRREHRKPVFATRDFVMDPALIQQAFSSSTEGFQFPSVPERYRISGIPAKSESPVSGVMARDGLDTLVDLAESGSQLFRFGRLNAMASLLTAVLGAVILLIPAWQGNWHFVSAANAAVYMLLWLLPVLFSRFCIRK